jgi:DnaJ domain
MDTLYDLLGALPQDDAEGLRTAFRRAVKGAHPDLRPDDPDAAVRFRQIVRANEILCDRDQRAAYDHLLLLALHEKDPAAAHPIAAKIHKIASGVVAFASISIVSVVGYLLFMHMSVALVSPVGSLAVSHASANAIDLRSRLSDSIAAVSSVDAPDPAAVNAFIAARAEGNAPGLVNAMAMAPVDAENAAPSGIAGSDPATNTATVVRPREVSAREVPALGSGDIAAVMVNPDQVTQLDQKFTAPYVDRGILFFRGQKDDHNFPDLPPLKRAEKPGHPKSLLAAAAKGHQEPPPKTVPLPIPRTAPPRFVESPQPWTVSATFQ